MSKEDFEAMYCGRSNITRERYKQWFITLSCACDYKECKGWAAVHNSPDMIKDHLELYAPREIE